MALEGQFPNLLNDWQVSLAWISWQSLPLPHLPILSILHLFFFLGDRDDECLRRERDGEEDLDLRADELEDLESTPLLLTFTDSFAFLSKHSTA